MKGEHGYLQGSGYNYGPFYNPGYPDGDLPQYVPETNGPFDHDYPVPNPLAGETNLPENAPVTQTRGMTTHTPDEQDPPGGGPSQSDKSRAPGTLRLILESVYGSKLLRAIGGVTTKFNGSSDAFIDQPGDEPSHSLEVAKGYFVTGPKEMAVDTVKGIWEANTDPIGTVSNLWTAATHPILTFNVLKDDLVNQWNSGYEGQGAVSFKAVSTILGTVKTVAEIRAAMAAAKEAKAAAAAAAAEQAAKQLDEAKAIEAAMPQVAEPPIAPSSVRALTQAEQRAVSKIDNILNKNFKQGPKGDISGAIHDMTGNPIPKPGGGTYDHVQDLGNILRGLRNNADALKNATDPAGIAARQRALLGIQQIEEAIKGAGL